MPTVNEALQSEIIRHLIHSEKFGKGLADKTVRLLNTADADLTGEIAARLASIEARGIDTGPATTTRLEALLGAVKAINDQVYSKIGDELQSELHDVASYEAGYQQRLLVNSISVDFPVTIPSGTTLRAIVESSPIDGHLLKSWTDTMSSARQARVEQVIRKGIASGDTIDDMVKSIRGTKAAQYSDGILKISRQSAQTLALTANSTVTNNARLAVYQDNKKLVPKVQWLSVLDRRTSPFCQQHDGLVYPIDKPHPTPPAHPRCRSVLLPVTASFKSLGLDIDETDPADRASMNGQVAGHTTYGDWLEKQSKATQDAALGQARGAMFRSGKLDFKDMFRVDGSYKSLAELSAAER